MNTIKRLLIWPFRMIFNAARWVFRTVLGSIMWVLHILWRAVKWVATIPKMLWKGVVATYHMLWSGVCMIGRVCIAVPVWLWHKFTDMIGAIIRSPRQAYEKCRYARDWLLAKVEYLQTESTRWRTLFTTLKLPYSALRMMGVSPNMAISMLVAGTAVGGGAIVNEAMQPPSFSAGDAGIYNAPLDAPVFYEEQFNTLRLDLGATSVGNITIENVSLGTAYTGSALPGGETSVILIGGLPTVADPAFTQTYLEVGHLIIDRWRCERLDISNSEIHTLIVSGNASDGQSISAVAGTPRNRGIGGGNRADDMTTQGGVYDMLKITAASSGVNGKVDVLRLSNLYSKGGACTIQYVKAGTMEVTLNEVGGDESLATKAFTIATSVIYKSFTNESNVEVAMAVPAIQ